MFGPLIRPKHALPTFHPNKSPNRLKFTLKYSKMPKNWTNWRINCLQCSAISRWELFEWGNCWEATKSTQFIKWWNSIVSAAHYIQWTQISAKIHGINNNLINMKHLRAKHSFGYGWCHLGWIFDWPKIWVINRQKRRWMGRTYSKGPWGLDQFRLQREFSVI